MTAGFGSTMPYIIQANGVHYDCGCIISGSGELVGRANRPQPNVLSVPAVYVAFFSTFGAMVGFLTCFSSCESAFPIN